MEPDFKEITMVDTFEKKAAKSGHVNYIQEPIILKNNSKSVRRLIPHFIKRSAGEQLCLKIETETKQPSGVIDFNATESISLGAAETQVLVEALPKLLGLSELSDLGKHMIIPLSGESADFKGNSAKDVVPAILHALSSPELVSSMRDKTINFDISDALKTGIRVNEMGIALDELKQNLNNNINSEITYQKWCEKHFWVFGNAVVMNEEIRSISRSDNIDLLLKNIMGYSDILEIKRPDMKVLIKDKSHNTYHFSSDVSAAIGQCHRYMDAIHYNAQKGLDDHPDILAYHPRTTILIGRSNNYSVNANKALYGLNARMNGVSVMTYDNLILRAENLLKSLQLPSPNSSPDDDLPF